ncbi:MAG: hypothetical protein RMN52_11315 [Anaerolineae bacterium]|nr:hypothetical protein [Candidatus Roseilinea sp.]MDW8450580.1 hypothetical protein [Anaerolineae bacterium]
MSYWELLLNEIKEVPEEHLPALFEIIRLFRRSVTPRSEANERPWEALRSSLIFYEAPFEPVVELSAWEVYRDPA